MAVVFIGLHQSGFETERGGDRTESLVRRLLDGQGRRSYAERRSLGLVGLSPLWTGVAVTEAEAMTISPLRPSGALASREPLGRILLVCGPGCSAELVADHLQAALDAGNSLVVAFVEEPLPATERLLDLLASTLSHSVFERLTVTGGPWNLTLPNPHVVSVLTALHIVVAEERRRHGRKPAGTGPTRSLLRLFTAPVAIAPTR